MEHVCCLRTGLCFLMSGSFKAFVVHTSVAYRCQAGVHLLSAEIRDVSARHGLQRHVAQGT